MAWAPQHTCPLNRRIGDALLLFSVAACAGWDGPSSGSPCIPKHRSRDLASLAQCLPLPPAVTPAPRAPDPPQAWPGHSPGPSAALFSSSIRLQDKLTDRGFVSFLTWPHEGHFSATRTSDTPYSRAVLRMWLRARTYRSRQRRRSAPTGLGMGPIVAGRKNAHCANSQLGAAADPLDGLAHS